MPIIQGVVHVRTYSGYSYRLHGYRTTPEQQQLRLLLLLRLRCCCCCCCCCYRFFMREKLRRTPSAIRACAMLMSQTARVVHSPRYPVLVLSCRNSELRRRSSFSTKRENILSFLDMYSGLYGEQMPHKPTIVLYIATKDVRCCFK